MAVEYTTTGTMQLGTAVKVLIYSNAGLGKTMLCATAPAPLILSAESGMLSLTKANIERVHGVDTPGISYDIPVATIKAVEDLTEIFNFLQTPDALRFKTVCLDSLSEIAETILANAKLAVNDGRQAYGALADETIDMLKKFRELPHHHVYFSAKKGFSEASRLNGPSFPGQKLDEEVPYLFDLLMELTLSDASETKGQRFLRTAPDLKNYAKDRSGLLDPRGEYPHLGHLFQKISGVAQ